MSISPDPVFQILTGFWASKVLMAAVEMDVFTKLDGMQVTGQELQKLLGMEDRPAQVFASALVSVGLLEARNGRFSNSQIAATFLSQKSPAYMGGFVRMVDERLYKAWDNLAWSLANNKPVKVKQGGDAESLFNDAKNDKSVQEIQKFTHAMHGVSIGPAMALAKVFDFSKYKSMIDIGGGSGAYAISAAKEYPNMSATVADLAPVCQVADSYISSYGLGSRVKTMPFDFWKQDVPKGHDVAFLSHIIHDYDEEKGIGLLKKIYSSLQPGGAVIISEWMLNDERTGPVPSAMMGLNMIIETNGGKNYSFAEIAEMLKKAGFKNMEKRSLAGPAQIAIGYK
jgi:2-polyprenyl-3-methyl-5-hydroxy-6-metoxy-1,4-benzoquinol methylase